tara:strand:+ start:313 stop:654 length:342 start_codon:yes stop_codon:yes gene_type:complete
MDLLYFVLTAYGLTQILVYGTIFNSVRPTKGQLGELFHCPMCFGFWAGAFLFGINRYTELFTFEYTFANLLILSCLSSGTSYILNMIIGDEGIKHEHKYLDAQVDVTTSKKLL